MALTDRQIALFNHTVDLYRPHETPAGVYVDHTAADVVYELAYSGVRCYVEFTSEFDQPSGGIGLFKTINFETLDGLNVEFSQEVAAGWKYQFTTTGHAEQGGWWSVLGNAKSLDRANTKELYSRRDLKPPLLAS